MLLNTKKELQRKPLSYTHLSAAAQCSPKARKGCQRNPLVCIPSPQLQPRCRTPTKGNQYQSPSLPILALLLSAPLCALPKQGRVVNVPMWCASPQLQPCCWTSQVIDLQDNQIKACFGRGQFTSLSIARYEHMKKEIKL